MPILNMVGGGKQGGNIGEPLNLSVISVGTDATIKWEDNEIGTIPPTSFAKSELVRKVGSAPTSPSDGTLVVTETVKDTYKVSGYTDSGLTYGTTYYYRVFSYSDLGGISYCDAVSVTPQVPIIPTNGLLAYYPMNSDWNDHKSELGVSGTTYNCTASSTFIYEYTTGKVGDCLHKPNLSTGLLDTGITLGSDYTVMMWLKVPTWSSWWIGFSTKNSDSGNGISAQWNFGETYNVGIKVKSSHYYYQNYTYVADTWMHYCVSKSGGTYKIYVNGTPQTFSADSNVGPRTLTLLGVGEGQLQGFPQYMDEVCIYNRVLTDQEVSDYYTATA